jgi:hypothetical protein
VFIGQRRMFRRQEPLLFDLHCNCIVAKQSEEYEAKAQECEEHANRAVDADIRELWLAVAKQWRLMADRLRKYNV